jgi:hypothetical protein
LLHTAGENAGEFFHIFGCDVDGQGMAAHGHSIGQNNST